MGEVTRILIRDSRDNFMTNKDNKETYFYTIKDKLEIAFMNNEGDTLFINEDYLNKSNVKKIISEIKKKYNIKKTTKYFNLKGFGI